MKKYIWLVLGTGLAVALICGIGAFTKQDPVAVELVTVEARTVSKTVTCTGKVEATDGRDVYVDVPTVAKEVYVKEGQTVRQGDVLFSVDAEATEQALSSLSASLSGLVPIPNEPITAPVSGTVVTLNVQAGEVTDHTRPCVVIAQGEGMQIAVAIRERHLPKVQEGQAVTVTGVAFSKEEYRGTVYEIAASAHQEYIGTTSETVVDAVIVLDEGMLDESLRVGLNARAEIVVDTRENAVLIPYECLAQSDTGEEYVYVYGQDGIACRRAVQVGEAYADGVLVVSGISAGERLVKDPGALSGERVRVRG